MVQPSRHLTAPSAQGPVSPVSQAFSPPAGSGPWQVLQVLHWQAFEQDLVCDPQSQQSRDSCWPAAQGPWPWQEDQPPHAQFDWHVRVRVPQLPQASDWVWPGVHSQVVQPPGPVGVLSGTGETSTRKHSPQPQPPPK